MNSSLWPIEWDQSLQVIRAAATKPFGFVPLPGHLGHCIPIDPFYLTWKAREYGMHTRFIELAGEINTAMPAYVLKLTAPSAGKPWQLGVGARHCL